MKVKELSPILMKGAKIAKSNAIIPILTDALIKEGRIYFTDLKTWFIHDIDTVYEGMFPLHSVIKVLRFLNRDSEVKFANDGGFSMSLTVDGNKIASWGALDNPVDFPKVPKFNSRTAKTQSRKAQSYSSEKG